MVSAALDLDLDHLRPEVREHAMEREEERIRRIRTDRCVPFSRAAEGLNLLEELLAYPERTCMPNLVIHADAGMGKTMLATKFRRDHPPSFDAETGAIVTPVIFVEMPSAPDEGRFYTRLLDSICAPSEPRATLARKEAMAVRILPPTPAGHADD